MPLLPRVDKQQDASTSSVASEIPARAAVLPPLLCTDLDRTLLPNGLQPASPLALDRFRRLFATGKIRLAYVSGRRLALIEQAIDEYDLPVPDYAVADVGTSIFRRRDDRWESVAFWEDLLRRSWSGRRAAELHEFLSGIAGLRLQEPVSQGHYKLSYYASPGGLGALRDQIAVRLDYIRVRSEIITSIDETTGTGLIDVLPAEASKLHAVQCVSRLCGAEKGRIVFAGDSGNDLPVLTSGIQSVLVANAAAEVAAAARRGVVTGAKSSLYQARGGFHGMNGNYTAGVLEGFAHFVPDVDDWLREIVKRERNI